MKLKTKTLTDTFQKFHPLIVRNDDSFCVYLPEWRVIGVGSSLEEAYREFEEKCGIIEAHCKEFGLSAFTPEAYPVLAKGAFLSEFMLFFLKAVTGVFVAILLVVLLLPNISAALRHSIEEILPKEVILTKLKDPRYWALQFPTEVNARLDQINPEDEEKMRIEWGKLLSRTVPVASQIVCR